MRLEHKNMALSSSQLLVLRDRVLAEMNVYCVEDSKCLTELGVFATKKLLELVISAAETITARNLTDPTLLQ